MLRKGPPKRPREPDSWKKTRGVRGAGLGNGDGSPALTLPVGTGPQAVARGVAGGWEVRSAGPRKKGPS